MFHASGLGPHIRDFCDVNHVACRERIGPAGLVPRRSARDETMPFSFICQRPDSTWLVRLVAAFDAVSARGRNHAIDADLARDFEAHFLSPRGAARGHFRRGH